MGTNHQKIQRSSLDTKGCRETAQLTCSHAHAIRIGIGIIELIIIYHYYYYYWLLLLWRDRHFIKFDFSNIFEQSAKWTRAFLWYVSTLCRRVAREYLLLSSAEIATLDCIMNL